MSDLQAKRGIITREETKEDIVPLKAHVEDRDSLFSRKSMSKHLPIDDNAAP